MSDPGIPSAIEEEFAITITEEGVKIKVSLVIGTKASFQEKAQNPDSSLLFLAIDVQTNLFFTIGNGDVPFR